MGTGRGKFFPKMGTFLCWRFFTALFRATCALCLRYFKNCLQPLKYALWKVNNLSLIIWLKIYVTFFFIPFHQSYKKLFFFPLLCEFHWRFFLGSGLNEYEMYCGCSVVWNNKHFSSQRMILTDGSWYVIMRDFYNSFSAGMENFWGIFLGFDLGFFNCQTNAATLKLEGPE